MSESKDCMICHQNSATVKICCAQHYHVHCILEWITRNPTCPICHQNLKPEILVEFNIINDSINNINNSISIDDEDLSDDDPDIIIPLLPTINDTVFFTDYISQLRHLVRTYNNTGVSRSTSDHT